MLSRFHIGVIVLSILSITTQVSASDPYLWLEDVDSQKALDWVKRTNQATEKSLMRDPLYQSLYQDALTVLNNKDKLPSITQRGRWIYNYWKGDTNPRGIYRRTSVESFNSNSPKWQTVLDIDKMSAEDNVKWVFKGMQCLKPAQEICLVNLSPGGGDAHMVREFNTKSLSFVEDGFYLPTAKSSASWIDENHLYVGTDFGPGSMTDSGYPRIQKIWQRGTDLSEAKTVLEVDKQSVSASARHFSGDKQSIDLLVEGLSFWTRKYSQYIDGKVVPLNLPETASVIDVIDGQLVVKLQKDWEFNQKFYKLGSVLLIEPALLRGEKGALTVLVKQTDNAIVEDVIVTAKGILVISLQDVKSVVDFYEKQQGKWQSRRVKLPNTGQIAIETSDDSSGEFFVRFEDFLTPPTLYSVNENLDVKVALQQSATFDGSKFMVKQYFANSKDGTRVPYFVVMNKNTRFDGKNPTHIFAYGGFRASLTPSYSGSYEDLNGAYGKMWLERGGVFVLANIRGGGEYGPAWHSAALLENRHKAYEDFEAIAQALINSNITSAKHLGIEGRSNGGLLVGATMTRRPDLYGAVICGVPLLDMKRYHKLLAGASWMAEYGNPDTDDWQFIKQYSPYQNLDEDKTYPPIFFFTSTRDDRVHPGHARKMAAKMRQQGHKIEYYENLEGGHKGSSTSEQLAKRITLGYTHLWKQLK